KSSFTALETSALKRFGAGLTFQVSYTWSHAIDNQGDPLVGGQFSERAFQVQFDPSGDRGNSDFDQRHNLTYNVLWQTPRLQRRGWLGAIASRWQFAGIAGYRSGFPFSVIARPRAFVTDAGPLILSRADFKGGDPKPPQRQEFPGGVILLDRSLFANTA